MSCIVPLRSESLDAVEGMWQRRHQSFAAHPLEGAGNRVRVLVKDRPSASASCLKHVA